VLFIRKVSLNTPIDKTEIRSPRCRYKLLAASQRKKAVSENADAETKNSQKKKANKFISL